MAERTLVLGTNNVTKRVELEQLLNLPQLTLRTLREFENVADVIEDGTTFLENATKKAVQLALQLDHWVLGEDSGLSVDALGGAPGVYSARYAGEPCDDEANNDKLLDALKDVPEAKRTAHYVCTIVVADPTGRVRAQAEGRCDGRIAFARAGSNGFGYDPLFLFGDSGQTFGQLPTEVKHANSHRAAAVAQLRPQLESLLSEW